MPLYCWLGLDLAIMMARAPLVVYLMRPTNPADPPCPLWPWTIDLYVGLGTLWSAVLGIGTFSCLLTNDPGLSVLAALLTMGTIGLQASRSPGSPRMNTVQMCLITVPFIAGTLMSELPGVRWAALVG